MVQYYLTRAHGNLELLEQLDLVGRTGELAKLFGIQGGDSIMRSIFHYLQGISTNYLEVTSPS